MADFQDSNFYMCMPTLETFRPSRLVCTYIPGDYYYFFFLEMMYNTHLRERVS